MITAATLRTRTVKDLAAMAKGEGVSGWHSMRKEQLVKALLKLAKEEAQASKKSSKKSGKNGARTTCKKGGKCRNRSNGSGKTRDSDGRFKSSHSAASEADKKRLKQIREKLIAAKNLAHKVDKERQEAMDDRLVLMVRDPFWLQAYWELTPQTIQRAKVALGQHWHAARPILRLLEVAKDDAEMTTKRPIRDIVVHGNVNNWYIDVSDPPKSFQMEIGYLATNGRFLCLARSNIVSTAQNQQPNTSSVDGNWQGVAEDYDRIYAMSGGYDDTSVNSDLKHVFEKNLHRPMGPTLFTRFGLGAQNAGHTHDEFSFEVDAEVVVFGVAEPGSQVTLKGEPIPTKADGTFTMRFPLGDRRQVYPVVANSCDGMEQRTIILAVERNTKVLSPVMLEPAQ
ncbi:MAG: DUF4912 domain-containing protein [Pirellulales bacterium]|nr:DUF4912 domain-containing protein [Pirellulales bacterium]